MTGETTEQSLTLGIVGAGLMGRGIAQISVLAGFQVILYDSCRQTAEEARQFIQQMLERALAKGRLTQDQLQRAHRNLSLASQMTEMASCQVVIEAILEDMDAKHQLFRSLEEVVADDCLLATNTSSLSVTAIAAACQHPGRVGGFHFFSPVPLMKVVEVIDGLETESWVGDLLEELAHNFGHTPVRAKDTPGFIVNHAGRGYGSEALRILGEGVADISSIDRILRDAAGFRMGPFELFDLTGLDISHPVMESIYHQFYEEPRFRPSPITRQRLSAGILGRKTGRGFYTYHNGQVETSAEDQIPEERPDRVWVSRVCPQAHSEVVELVRKLGGTLDLGVLPQEDSLCLVMPLGFDATSAALSEGLDPVRTLALDILFGVDKRRTLMTTPVTGSGWRKAAHGLLSSDDVPVSVIRDSAGFVTQRVVALIVNIACEMAQQQIASPKDIDRAVSIGLGYPQGPLAWGNTLGPKRLLGILEAIHQSYGDPRYRPSPWLARRSRLGVSLLCSEI